MIAEHVKSEDEVNGLIFNIQHYSIHDGPGIRTTVFLKKCPLKCIWCQNPEGISGSVEIGHSDAKCRQCYKCVQACPQKAICIPNEGGCPEIDRRICKGCTERACLDACSEGALELIGRYQSAEEVFKEVVKDSWFYRDSGGGVTISGGEACSQPEFCISLLRKCQDRGIHTALDTSGFASPDVFSAIIGNVDLVLLDIKHMDSNQHKVLTGVNNEIILQNARLISELGIPMIFRIPVIPGHNDDRENMDRTAKFAETLGVESITLLPFHALAVGKYKRLGQSYPCEDFTPPADEQMTHLKKTFEAHGLTTHLNE